MTGPIVRCEGLVQVYGTTGQEVTALRGVDLVVAEGGAVALLGPSGAGKSTLLWLFAGLLQPTAGLVEVCGRRLADLGPRAAAQLRRHEVGMVMQTPARNLLPYETVAGNVQFALAAVRQPAGAKRRRVASLLEAVGLAPLAHRPAARLSGGEQQRLAVAVALANQPRLLLADEPTSQLDHQSAAAVVELLREAGAEHGTTVIIVTHDPAVGAVFPRTVTIRDGRVGAEGHAGEDYLVVARDGSVQLPESVLAILPPGSLARAIPTPHGVELRRASQEEG